MHKAKVVSRVLVLGLKYYSITVPLKKKYIHVNRTGHSTCWSILPRYSRLIIYFRKHYLKKKNDCRASHNLGAYSQSCKMSYRRSHKVSNPLIFWYKVKFSWNLRGASTPAGITLKFQKLEILILRRRNFARSCGNPESKVHGASMGPTWVLSAPDGPHVGPMNLAIREGLENDCLEAVLCKYDMGDTWPGGIWQASLTDWTT